MSRRRAYRGFVRMLALLYVILASGPAANAVVCVGSNGHLAIESVLADECCPSSVQSQVPQISVGDDCHDCFDTPLALKGTIQRSGAHGDVPRLLHVATSISTARERSVCRQPHASFSALRETISAHRTIVLLI